MDTFLVVPKSDQPHSTLLCWRIWSCAVTSSFRRRWQVLRMQPNKIADWWLVPLSHEIYSKCFFAGIFVFPLILFETRQILRVFFPSLHSSFVIVLLNQRISRSFTQVQFVISIKKFHIVGHYECRMTSHFCWRQMKMQIDISRLWVIHQEQTKSVIVPLHKVSLSSPIPV